MRTLQRRRLGFTLVELLVVIGLILVLLAVIVPVYSAFTTGSRQEGAQNLLDAMLAQGRVLALRYGREVALVAYWRGQDKDGDGLIGPAERFDDSQTLILLMRAHGVDPGRLPAGSTDLEPKFYPLEELLARSVPGAILSPGELPDPAFTSGEAAFSPSARMPRGMTLATPNPFARSDSPSTADGPPFLDFVVIRIDPQGRVVTAPMIVGADAPEANLRQWLADADSDWLLDEGQINAEDEADGDPDSASDWNPRDADRSSSQRQIFMDVPDSGPATRDAAYKLVTRQVVMLDELALEEAGVNLASIATDVSMASEFRRQVEERGSFALINPYTARASFQKRN